MIFANRHQAGQTLARALKHYRHPGVVVLALPRGGVEVGAEVAKKLRAPLDLVLVRKIGHPLSPEYAIGAIAENEKPIYNRHEIQAVEEEWLEETQAAAKLLIEQRREQYYGDDFERPDLTGKTIILVDDGIATGLTMEAAAVALKRKEIKELIIAVPVAPADSVNNLQQIADQVIVLSDPDKFRGAVGSHYREFDQVGDEEVRMILREVRDGLLQKTARA